MKLQTVLFSALVSLSATAFDGQKLIYGEDNRQDVFEARNAAFIKLSRSTAAHVPVGNLVATAKGFDVKGPTFASRGMCSTERFAQQITSARCSGFLVGPKLLVTAGHCIENMNDCRANNWVFDYKMENAGTTTVNVPKSSVYSCSKIISRALEGGSGDDYALIELDRVVTGRDPLEVRKTGKPAVGDELVVIGHPSGLPTKIADGAKVRSLRGPYFVANLDTYGGNSGSAVFNVNTGKVEGILVRGETDYVRDTTRGCMVSNLCPDTGCRGEDVTYITNVKEITGKRL